jgi:hypothetical protein
MTIASFSSQAICAKHVTLKTAAGHFFSGVMQYSKGTTGGRHMELTGTADIISRRLIRDFDRKVLAAWWLRNISR